MKCTKALGLSVTVIDNIKAAGDVLCYKDHGFDNAVIRLGNGWNTTSYSVSVK